MMLRSLLLLSIMLQCLSLTGCSSRLINTSVSGDGRAPSARAPIPSPVSYRIIARREDKDAERALNDALAARGLSGKAADVPDGAGLHLVVYLLESEPSQFDRVMLAPLALLEFGTMGLLPVCSKDTFPVEIHALASPGGSGGSGGSLTSTVNARYTVDNCMWLPMMVKNKREMDEAKYSALRDIFGQTLERLGR